MKILFISHDASRTGAPLILLNFARWLKKTDGSMQFHFLLLRGGEMENEFHSVGKTYTWSEKKSGKQNLTRRIKDKIFKDDYRENLKKELKENNYNIIYANTVAACAAADELVKYFPPKSKVIAHIHELNAIIRMLEPRFDNLVPQIDLFIAVSNSVRDNLIMNWKVSMEKIRVVNEFASVNEIKKNIANSEEISVDLDFLKNKFVVGSSGLVHWRKGYDLFILAAKKAVEKNPEFNGVFLWVGKISDEIKIIIEEDLRKLNLAHKVFFIGEKKSPFKYYNMFDVFLMTSREDPFPLVVIEAGMLGKPVICFENAGGTVEMIASGGGKTVPYFDVEAMADEILSYYSFPKKKEEDGKISAKEFLKYDIDTIAPQIMNVINEAAR